MPRGKSNRFSALGSALRGETLPEQQLGVEPAVEIEEVQSVQAEAVLTPVTVNPEQPRRRKTGKRSDPSYEQAGVYLPKDLHRRVKQKLLEHDNQDFSDLVAQLLQQWVNQ